MSDEIKKISKNRAKKMEIVANLNEKLAKSKSIIFTNYQGLTHKQLEGLKKAIKPMKAEFVVAKNSLILRALGENKIKINSSEDEEKQFKGPTGTLLIYEDVVGPLRELAKLVKELGIPNVKFGIVDKKNLTGEQIMKLSTLPGREILLTQIVVGLKSPILGLHRALIWNLQKLVLTLNAVALAKPAVATLNVTPKEEIKTSNIATDTTSPIPQVQQIESEKTSNESTVLVDTKEINEENKAKKEIPDEKTQEEQKSEGGEN